MPRRGRGSAGADVRSISRRGDDQRARELRTGLRHRPVRRGADVARQRRRARRRNPGRRLARRDFCSATSRPAAATGCGSIRTARSRRPITVHSDAAAPWDPSIYNQKIKDSGYQYLTTRDGTKLAIDVHPPTDVSGVASGSVTAALDPPTGPHPTLIEYAGYGYARSALGGRSGERIELLANIMGFTVVDVNMRGTGCSGGAFDFFEPLPEPRRLRRDRDDRPPAVGARPQGRDDGHLIRRHQPAVHRPARPAGPRGDRATVGDRRHRHDAVPGRHPQHRLCRRLGRATPAGGPAGGLQARQPCAYQQIKQGDETCKAEPGPARRGGQPHGQDPREQPLHPVGGRPARPGHVRPQDSRAGVHGLPVGGRADRRPLPRSRPALHRHQPKWFNFTNGAHIDSLDPYTYDHWYDFLELFVAHQAPAINPYNAAVQGGAPLVYQAAMGAPDSDSITLPPDPIQQDPTLRLSPGGFREAARGAGAVRQRCRHVPHRRDDGRGIRIPG